eukprot:TRINITY_DN92816_c0_g1_i1.p1 TRINITY_DN92816_c0_g1~~TRINITY_DN92816_c0_g1_i1.p1  ORF type:complete len:508 (-),score=92.57 TRINITY_DN92816_c0_g1_i1:120-1643(-)
MAFMDRFAPNGQTWRDYVGCVPPARSSEGKLIGQWGECVMSSIIFEYTDGSAPATGEVFDYAQECGYGDYMDILSEAEGWMTQEMKEAQGDPHAFMRHLTPYGTTWKAYCEKCKPKICEKTGFVNGAWGQCITAAVIFEHQNPNWSQLPAYMDDGPAGQVLMFFDSCGHGEFMDALYSTEGATHQAVDANSKLPVFEEQYQDPGGSTPATHVNEDPPEMTGVKRALLIGCNYPGTKAQLNGCINDVNTWKGVLTEVYGFEEKNCLVLTDDQSDKRLQPTCKNMKNAMRWLAEGAKPGDVLFLSFSGHGTQRRCTDGSEADGKDEALCPTDYATGGFVMDNEIFDLVCTPLESGVKLTIILDCCHSGTAVDLSFTWEGGSWAEVGGTKYVAGDIQMFSGCQDEQCSMDVSIAGRAQGAMTMCMTQAIRENNEMEYPALLARLHEILKEKGYEQLPRLTSSQPFEADSKSFDLTQGAIPNMNEVLGSTGPPRKHGTREAAIELEELLFG